MARLFRFVKLNDRFDTHVYTFLIPGRVIHKNCHEIFCKDITFGYQRWTMSFMKSETHLSAYLKLRMNYTGVTVTVDYCITLVNRQHFTKNDTVVEKNCSFTRDECTKGRKSFVCLYELAKRKFAQENGDFMIELELRNVHTTFDCLLKLVKSPGNTFEKLESSYFTFGLDDWSVSLTPQGHVSDSDIRPVISLHRHTSFDHCSSVKYQIHIGADFGYESDVLLHNFDISGTGPGYVVNSNLDEIKNCRSEVQIRVEIQSVTTYSHVTIDALTRGKNRGHFYDRDKQAWMIESNVEGSYLMFTLYYTDISHVPRKYSRFVNWNVIVSDASGVLTHALQGPFSKYYVQQDLDEGFIMATAIPSQDITRSDTTYLDADSRKLSVYVEWIDSQLLGIPSYHRLDDVFKVQRHQMQRELLALQAENYALEKQLYSYQQCMAKKDTKLKDDVMNGDVRTNSL